MARKPGPKSWCALGWLDGVGRQRVEANDALAPLQHVGHRCAAALIRQGELTQPLVEGRDATVEVVEFVSGFEPPNRSEVAQPCGIWLGCENRSTSWGIATGASSRASTKRENCSVLRVID